jgi:hypothetical protein
MTARLDARMAVVTGAAHETGRTLAGRADTELEQHRAQLIAHCRRMLGSPFEAALSAPRAARPTSSAPAGGTPKGFRQ